MKFLIVVLALCVAKDLDRINDLPPNPDVVPQEYIEGTALMQKCRYHSDCPFGYYCDHGKCKKNSKYCYNLKCKKNIDCPRGCYCHKNNNRCFPKYPWMKL